MRVGLVFQATGHYRTFVPAFLESAREHFLRGAEVRFLAFTDFAIEGRDVIRFPIEHAPWPRITLERYHRFCERAGALGETDFLFYSDVDMRFVAPCDAAILPPGGHGLVGTIHPNYYRRNEGWHSRLSLWAQAAGLPGGLGWHTEPPFERDPRSRAALPPDPARPYYCGGFNGGETAAFLTMSRAIRDAVDDDDSRGVVARWHDESHLNRYLAEHPPHALTPRYCFPETGFPHLAGMSPVLVALDKDHDALRADPAG